MNANAFEFNMAQVTEGRSNSHDSFVSEYLGSPDSTNKLESDIDKGANKIDDLGSKFSDGKPSDNNHTRMDGAPLYPDKKSTEPGGLKDQIEESIKKLDNITKPHEQAQEAQSIEDILGKKMAAPITDKHREHAKNRLEKEIPGIVDAKDRAKLVNIQDALVEGDMNELAKAIQSLGKDGEDKSRFIEEINRQLEKLGSDTELIETKDGRVFVHDGFGDLAVQLNPDGSSEVRAVDRTRGGAIVVNPGEVLNRSVKEVGRNIGNSTTRDLQKLKEVKPDIRKPGGKVPKADKIPEADRPDKFSPEDLLPHLLPDDFEPAERAPDEEMRKDG